METIFKSWINLSFCNGHFEIEYQTSKDVKIRKSIKTYTLSILIFTIITSITDSFFYNNYKLMGFKITTFTAYLLTVLYIPLYILSLKCEKMSYLRMLNYANFYFLIFHCINFRYPLVIYASTNLNNLIYFYFFLIELIIRLIWVTHGVIGFNEISVISIISIVSLGTWKLAIILNNKDFYYSLVFFFNNITMLLICVLISYFIENSQKQCSYYNLLAEKKNSRFNNIFANMRTGLLSIKGQNLTYINSFLFEKILKITKFQEKFKEERIYEETKVISNLEEIEIHRINYLKPNLEMILRGLISNLNNNNMSKYYFIIKRCQYKF